ncbi:MAG: hypothetical protein A3G75_07785, partial [Verrucomicrobia bacterium RIFCSPLOWO2_12_FULL_64_8]
MPRRPVMALLSYFLTAAGVLALGYVALLLFAWMASDGMIFLPPPPQYAAGPGIIKIRTPDGVMLAARHLPKPGARFTLVYFHGNAEDLGTSGEFLEMLRDRLGVSVFSWDYRGYGLSGGRCGEPATLRDAHTVLAFLRDTLQTPPERLILLGYSLGGGPAVELAASRQCAGLVLDRAFTSAFRVMTRVRLLPFDKFIVLEKLPRVTCPVLVVHGTADEMIPFRHAELLFAAANGPKKKLWVEGAGHNDFLFVAGETYWR